MNQPSIRTIPLPRDTNALGTVFGGYILSQVDLAAAVEAQKHSFHKMVTVKVSEVEFKKPVYTGDLLSLYTETVEVGTKSVTVDVRVEAVRTPASGHGPFNEPVHVTQARLVFVAVDDTGYSVPLK